MDVLQDLHLSPQSPPLRWPDVRRLRVPGYFLQPRAVPLFARRGGRCTLTAQNRGAAGRSPLGSARWSWATPPLCDPGRARLLRSGALSLIGTFCQQPTSSDTPPNFGRDLPLHEPLTVWVTPSVRRFCGLYSWDTVYSFEIQKWLGAACGESLRPVYGWVKQLKQSGS